MRPDPTCDSARGCRSGGRRGRTHSRGSRPACGARDRDSPPRALCRRIRCRCWSCCPPSDCRMCRSCRAPARCRPPRTDAATVGGAAWAFKAHGKEKSGDLPPSGPTRALPRDGAGTARPQAVASPSGARRPRPRRPRPRSVRRRNSGIGGSPARPRHARSPRRAVSESDRSLDAYGAGVSPAGRSKKLRYIGKLRRY